jgi:RNA polymerase sigma-70 factor (ECF subfamily)
MVNEQEVWSKFKQGSETDFAYLYRLYAPVMFRYGSKLSSDRDLIKDCLQQVFLTLWKSRENLGNPASVKQYLLKALRSEIYKKAGRGLKYESISDDYHFKMVPSYESALIEQQSLESLKHKIADILLNLPPRQREIIFLK